MHSYDQTFWETYILSRMRWWRGEARAQQAHEVLINCPATAASQVWPCSLAWYQPACSALSQARQIGNLQSKARCMKQILRHFPLGLSDAGSLRMTDLAIQACVASSLDLGLKLKPFI